MKLALPQEYDAPIERFSIGMSFLLLRFAASRMDWVKRHFESLVYVGFCIVAIDFWTLIHRSGLSTVYLVGALIVAVCYNLAFCQFRPLVIYSAVVLALSTWIGLTAESTNENRWMFIAGILTVQITAIASGTLRAKVLKTLEKAKMLSLVLQERLIEKDLESAEVVQRTLLTENIDLPEISMSSYYRAAQRAGGDWYGHHHDKRHNVLYFCIGDVTGHGISSALVTGVACGAIYATERRADLVGDNASSEEHLLTMATVLNGVLCTTGGNRWMTMLFCALDLNTGVLRFINAGHNFPLQVRGSNGSVLSLNHAGDPLGFDMATSYSVRTVPLKRGDSLFLYTDGLLESPTASVSVQKNMLLATLKHCSDSQQLLDRFRGSFHELWSSKSLVDDACFFALTWWGKEKGVALPTDSKSA